MGKDLPFFPFYVGAWQKNVQIKSCSQAAKGVLIETLCLMWECEERGVLAASNRPILDKDWAMMVGGNMDVTLNCIAELFDRKVLERNPLGAAIYKPFVEAENKRRKTKERVRKHRSNIYVTRNMKYGTEILEEEGEYEGKPILELAEMVYENYPRKVAKPDALRAISGAISTYGFKFILDRTIAYSSAVKGTDTFLPYPATWFNADRFNDDPSEWANRIKTNGHAPKPLSLLDLRTVMEAKKVEAQDLKNRHCSEGPLSDDWDMPSNRSRYRQLQKEISEINQKIGAFKV